MKFKHTFNVFIDNFTVTYKQLLYRLIIALITMGLTAAIVVPLVNGLTTSPYYILLMDGIKALLQNILDGELTNIGATTAQIKEAFGALVNFVTEHFASIAWGVVGIVLIKLIANFFESLGNYATAAVINDRMALHAKSPFILTLIRNLKEACLYSLMYVPLSFLYDLVCLALVYLIVFKLFALLPFMYLPIQVFIALTIIVLAISVKMTLTSDWLPALIRGKTGQRKAFLYTFDRRKKNTLNVLSNFVVLVIIIFALNVAAILSTFGVGALLTIPSSYVVLISFEFVNYYDREELKYFIDKNTIIKPEKERPLTREEFFKGE